MVRTPQPSYADAPPRLIAEARPLDFLNTLSWAGDPRARGERLTSYAELLHWCRHAGLLTARAARRLATLAAADPPGADAVRRRALRLRAALRALVLGEGPPARATAALNRALAGLAWRQRLTPDGAIAREPTGPALKRPLALLAEEALALLAAGGLDRIHSCANARCGWVFRDSSRNRSRRWCRMETCGNRAKARKHYETVKAGSSTARRPHPQGAGGR